MNPRHRYAFLVVILNSVAVLLVRPALADPLGITSNPLREAYYGDLHLHTSYSLDAYLGGMPPVDPDEAYRFAQGQVVDYLGVPVQRREALDFMAVTDHAESLGVVNELDDPNSTVSRSEVGKAFLAIMARMRRPDGRLDTELLVDQPELAAELWTLEQVWGFGRKNNLPEDLRRVSAAAWAREIEFAKRHYQPGKFTTFAAFEWSPTPYSANLHRNIIFKGDAAPYPFAAQDSTDPEALWEWMDAVRQQGFEAIAIPHNGNASNGLMYNWIDSSGGSLDRRYAETRQAHEPVSEIMQNKGQSETHPLLSPNDEFADFEIFDYLADAWSGPREVKGSYLRDALSRGLVLQRQLGVNPFRYGFVGASDLHGGLSVSAQEDYAGNYYLVNLGGGKPTQAEAKSILGESSERVEATLETTSGGLTGVWAESNTRESIYAALSRRETFATSGTRLRFRFFGGWAFDDAMLLEPDWVRNAYAQGVPMGGDLPKATAQASAPTFALWVMKDPNGANLDRAQIIKVWEADGEQREKVFEVAWAGDRQPDPATGKLPPLGNSVDLNTGTVGDELGVVDLRAVWRDPDFDPDRFAAYYLRVLEIPTPRWSTLLAIQNGLPLPGGVSALIQQRGWSSPIWYAPPVSRHDSL